MKWQRTLVEDPKVKSLAVSTTKAKNKSILKDIRSSMGCNRHAITNLCDHR